MGRWSLRDGRLNGYGERIKITGVEGADEGKNISVYKRVPSRMGTISTLVGSVGVGGFSGAGANFAFSQANRRVE